MITICICRPAGLGKTLADKRRGCALGTYNWTFTIGGSSRQLSISLLNALLMSVTS